MSTTDDEKSPEDSSLLRQDALVDRLRPTPADAVLKVIELHGYLGQDTLAGYWRLYLRADLTSYLRIAETDIIDSQRSDSLSGKLIPSQVIVRAAAEVDCVTTGLLENQASFLFGEYTAALPESIQVALEQAAASGGQDMRPRRGPVIVPRYPATPGFPCRPQTTIQSNTCFCTIFCAK